MNYVLANRRGTFLKWKMQLKCFELELSVVVIIQYSEGVLISFAFHFAGAVSKQEPCFDNGAL